MNLGTDRAVVDWLLEEENPCIRYLTLTRLLDRSKSDDDVISARRRIPEWHPVKSILGKQKRNGGWDDGRTWYLPKYKSTLWQLILLSQTGIDPNLPSVRRMCDYAFRFQQKSGAFVSGMAADPNADWGRQAGCLNGNVIAALCRLGRGEDQRVRRAAQNLISFQERDGGWGCRSFGYHKNDKHSCFMGTICALEGLVEFSKVGRSEGLSKSLTEGCEFLLMHRLYKADHHGWKVIRSDYPKLRAPWLVGYGILRGLHVLTDAGVTRDPRMADALGLLESKRRPDGKWLREGPFPSTAYASFGTYPKADKWSTFYALMIRRRAAARR